MPNAFTHTVTQVYREASATRVLTLERLYGVSMTDLETVRRYSESPELALILALNTWVSSVLTNEWFHADVHAGNLLMLEDGRVAFIDFGIVGGIPRSTADAACSFLPTAMRLPPPPLSARAPMSAPLSAGESVHPPPRRIH